MLVASSSFPTERIFADDEKLDKITRGNTRESVATDWHALIWYPGEVTRIQPHFSGVPAGCQEFKHLFAVDVGDDVSLKLTFNAPRRQRRSHNTSSLRVKNAMADASGKTLWLPSIQAVTLQLPKKPLIP